MLTRRQRYLRSITRVKKSNPTPEFSVGLRLFLRKNKSDGGSNPTTDPTKTSSPPQSHSTATED